MTPLLPTAPLRQVVEEAARSMSGYRKLCSEYARRHGVSERTAWRRLSAIRERELIPVQVADEICTAARVHPIVAYGRLWEPVEADPEGEHQCPECPRRFAWEEALGAHLGRAHGQGGRP